MGDEVEAETDGRGWKKEYLSLVRVVGFCFQYGGELGMLQDVGCPRGSSEVTFQRGLVGFGAESLIWPDI